VLAGVGHADCWISFGAEAIYRTLSVDAEPPPGEMDLPPQRDRESAPIPRPDLPATTRRRVEWTDKLSVGVEAIDTQHRELCQRLDLFLRALSEKRSRGEIASLVTYLGQFIQEHFTTEEGMMASTGYAGLGDHVSTHHWFEDEYHRLADALDREGADFGIQRRLLGLVDWLEGHMDTADRDLGGYLSRLRSHKPFEPVFIEYQGFSILRLDYTQLRKEEFSVAFRKAGQLISTKPPGSLRVLTLLESRFDETVADDFKAYVAANRPFIRASAVVAQSFWNVIVTSARLHGRPNLSLFADEETGLDWLVDH
jgi:hemerythrin